jgi:hypothetical protein
MNMRVSFSIFLSILLTVFVHNTSATGNRDESVSESKLIYDQLNYTSLSYEAFDLAYRGWLELWNSMQKAGGEIQPLEYPGKALKPGLISPAVRAFSHGCVRVKDPLILTEELLGDKGYDSKKIMDVINSKKTQNVNLSEPMPVMIMYWTCYVDDQDGKIRFYRDVYGRDKKVLQELKRER